MSVCPLLSDFDKERSGTQQMRESAKGQNLKFLKNICE